MGAHGRRDPATPFLVPLKFEVDRRVSLLTVLFSAPEPGPNAIGSLVSFEAGPGFPFNHRLCIAPVRYFPKEYGDRRDAVPRFQT